MKPKIRHRRRCRPADGVKQAEKGASKNTTVSLLAWLVAVGGFWILAAVSFRHRTRLVQTTNMVAALLEDDTHWCTHALYFRMSMRCCYWRARRATIGTTIVVSPLVRLDRCFHTGGGRARTCHCPRRIPDSSVTTTISFLGISSLDLIDCFSNDANEIPHTYSLANGGPYVLVSVMNNAAVCSIA